MKQHSIEIRQLCVMRRERRVLKLEEVAIEAGEIIGLVGPNGAGKSTLLQVLNLQLPYERGELRLFGQAVAKGGALTLRRRCSMVFQDTLLLAGSVFDNVALALRFRGLSEPIIAAKVDAALQAFHCSHLIARPARSLSGGEAQRVCLARALVSQPEILLLDEPFAALDAATRGGILRELKEIARRQRMTVLLVSHNFQEVLAFAERALVLVDGRIVQDDLPETVLRRPNCREAARLVEMDNVLDGRIETCGGNSVVHLSPQLTLPLAGRYEEGECTLCIPGDAFSLLEGTGAGWIAQIVDCEPGIGTQRLTVLIAGLEWNVRLPWRESFVVGTAIFLQIAVEQLHVIGKGAVSDH